MGRIYIKIWINKNKCNYKIWYARVTPRCAGNMRVKYEHNPFEQFLVIKQQINVFINEYR